MNHNITIGWTGPISFKKYGGLIYGEQSRKALSKSFDLDFINVEGKYFKNKYLKAIESLLYLSKLKGKKDVWIRDFFSTLTMPIDKTRGKNVAIVHHVGFSNLPLILRIPYFILEKIYYHNLNKMNAIVVISEYWKNYFLERGYRNVYKIYCRFDLNDFNISGEEVADFKKKNNLDGKPIIYLGNCQRSKGVVESCNALKDLNVYLVTSGRRQVNVPAVNFNDSYREYLKLLKASSVAVTMSKIKEGWSMTTHEAMLCKTPVIGSGLGGMRELLEGGEQIICEDFTDLKEKVEYLLKNPEERKKMGEQGYDYAKDFTVERFEQSWVETIDLLTKDFPNETFNQ